MMKHAFLLVTLLAGCSLDDPAGDPSAAASQTTAGRTATTSTVTAGANATSPITTMTAPRAPVVPPTQPSAAGTRAAAPGTQPSAAGSPAAGAAAPRTQPAAAGAMSQTSCAALATCCTSLEDEDQENCQAAVNDADPAACEQARARLCPAPPTTTGECPELMICCMSLTDDEDQEECLDVAADADAAACGESLSELCPATPTTPGTTTGECPELMLCCMSLTDEDQEECLDVAADADAAACGESLAELCPATPTTPGTSSDDCPKLMLCCMSLTDDEDQEECLDVVADADAAACGESLTEMCPDPNAPPPPESDD